MLGYEQDGVLITERRNRQQVPSLTQKLYPVHNYSHKKKKKTSNRVSLIKQDLFPFPAVDGQHNKFSGIF